jgi:hypothetical protein
LSDPHIHTQTYTHTHTHANTHTHTKKERVCIPLIARLRSVHGPYRRLLAKTDGGWWRNQREPSQSLTMELSNKNIRIVQEHIVIMCNSKSAIITKIESIAGTIA